jgi:hypothetical protein
MWSIVTTTRSSWHKEVTRGRRFRVILLTKIPSRAYPRQCSVEDFFHFEKTSKISHFSRFILLWTQQWMQQCNSPVACGVSCGCRPSRTPERKLSHSESVQSWTCHSLSFVVFTIFCDFLWFFFRSKRWQ